jgi:cell wall-associated NlpC family hydrolase
MVFFANTYKRGISHIGIYIGNGKFVHAATSRTGVRVDSLASAYYRRKWHSARRVS